MKNALRSVKYSVISREYFYYPRLSHDDWTIYVVKKGAFRCAFEGHEDVVKKGDVYLVPPHVPFVRSVIDPITVHFIRFETPSPELLPFPLPRGRVTLGNTQRAQSTLHMMQAIGRHPTPHTESMLTHLLSDLLWQLCFEQSYPQENPQDVQDATVREILRFFEENYTERISINSLARRYALSPSGLIFKFRKATGLLPMRHLIEIRIRHAKDLLSNTSLPIGEIAERVGFDNCYYFSNAFKRETALSPSAYRRTYTI